MDTSNTLADLGILPPDRRSRPALLRLLVRIHLGMGASSRYAALFLRLSH